jgi:hypothetical protein
MQKPQKNHDNPKKQPSQRRALHPKPPTRAKANRPLVGQVDRLRLLALLMKKPPRLDLPKNRK